MTNVRKGINSISNFKNKIIKLWKNTGNTFFYWRQIGIICRYRIKRTVEWLYLNFTFSKYCESFIQPEMFKVGICDEISSPGMSYLNNVYSKIRFGVVNSLNTFLGKICLLSGYFFVLKYILRLSKSVVPNLILVYI